MRSLISVVIPCFNHGEYLPEAVASVVNAKREDVELVVVDDGSTDERTRFEMEALCRRGIHVIRQQNKGLAAARNAGISASAGEYILPLDADNRVRPAYFEHGVRILDSQPEVGVVYGAVEHFGEYSKQFCVGPFDAARLMISNFIDACAMLRRLVWEQTGGYDCNMPVQGYEDWDLWMGALEHGWKFAYIPEVVFDYRVSTESMLTRARLREAEVMKYIEAKHCSLYRRKWERLEQEHRSIRATSLNLAKLLLRNLRRTFRCDGYNADY